ncbi:MAG: AbrB/MazE/SpoVT family DNA-binding domain-containing protein [Dehalococcoidia bacterium]
MTIPKEFREALRLDPSDLLSISLHGDRLEIEPVRVASKETGSLWAARLHELFAPARESLGAVRSEEIDRAIEDAVREVRRGAQ